MTTPNRFSSIVAALVVVSGLLGTRVAYGADPQLIAIENAGDATLDDQSFHLPLGMSRQLAAIQGDAFSLIGARLLRYSNSGDLLQVGADNLVRHQLDGFEGLRAAPDGVVYAWSDRREYVAISPDGTVLWTHPAEGGTASPPIVDDDGAILFVRETFPETNNAALHLVKLRRDGSEAFAVALRVAQGLGIAQLDPVFDVRLLPVPGSSEWVLVGNVNFHTAIALRVRPDGSVRWYWKAPGRLRSQMEVPSANVLSDGSLLIGVQDTEDLSWDVFRVNAQGQVVSNAAFSTGGNFTNSLLVIEPAGRLYHLNFAPGGVRSYVGRDASGQALWTIDPGGSCEVACYFDSLANGDLLVAGQGAGGYRVERYSRSGDVSFALSHSQLFADAIGAYYLGETSDGQLLVSARRQSTASATSKVGEVTTVLHDELLWLGMSGETVRSVRQPDLAAPLLGSAHLSTSPNGQAVLVSPSTEFSYDQASVIGADGSVVQAALAPRDIFGPAIGTLVSNDRLIVAHRFGVRQYADLGLGSLMASTFSSERLTRADAYANGNLLVRTSTEHPEFSDVFIPKIRLLDMEGNDITLPTELLERVDVIWFDPEDAAIVSNGDDLFRLNADGSINAHFEPFGQPLWEIPQGFTFRTNTTLSLPDGDKLIFHVLSDTQTASSLLTRDVRAHIARLAPDNTVRWRQAFSQEGRLPETDLMFAAATANAQGQILLTSVHTGSNRVVLRAIDGSDGSVITRRVIDCPGIGCEATDFAVDALGQVQGVSFGGGPTDLDYTLIRIDDLWDRIPTLPVAAASGLWYALDTSGEGMAFQYDASSNVLAASWYTYSRTQENEPKQLRWYTLAGQVDPDGDEVALDVFEVQDGAFDSPPALPATAVGEAQLRLVDCDRLEVRLTIDDAQLFGHDSDTGIRDFTLSRLIPGQVDCVDRQGDIVQPAGAYDTRVTGAWYEPSSSGQGLFLYRFRPDGQDDFVFAGAWFAHDPAGSAGLDDPSPHWFSLLGSSPSESTFEAGITQTLGGHFGGTRTRNSRTIGSATLISHGCDRMSLDYRFEDSDEASAFAALSGAIELQRIAGTCDEASSGH